MEQSPRFVLQEADRIRFRRWTLAVAFLFAVFASFVWVHGFFAHKFHGNTGRAQWIWQNRPFVSSHDIDRRSGTPAAFFTVRVFVVPRERDFVHIKIAADPQYTLWFNGVEVGGGGDAGRSALEVYDVSDLARTGSNLMVVAVRSASGVGGLLAAVDFSRTRENVVVTDGSWRIYRLWRANLTSGNLKDLPWSAPRVLGQPPLGRWNYLRETSGKRATPITTVLYPSAARSFVAALPQIRDISGVVVVISLPVPARVYDFGFVRGHGRIESPSRGPRLVRVRYANDSSEFGGEGRIEPFVLAEGETSVTDPIERTFRYMIIYGEGATAASVVQAQ
jgi:hypothetical protein